MTPDQEKELQKSAEEKAEKRFPGYKCIFALRRTPEETQIMFGADTCSEILEATNMVMPPSESVSSQIVHNVYIEGYLAGAKHQDALSRKDERGRIVSYMLRRSGSMNSVEEVIFEIEQLETGESK